MHILPPSSPSGYFLLRTLSQTRKTLTGEAFEHSALLDCESASRFFENPRELAKALESKAGALAAKWNASNGDAGKAGKRVRQLLLHFGTLIL